MSGEVMVVCGSGKFYHKYKTATRQRLGTTPADLLQLTRGLCFRKSIFADYFILYLYRISIFYSTLFFILYYELLYVVIIVVNYCNYTFLVLDPC